MGEYISLTIQHIFVQETIPLAFSYDIGKIKKNNVERTDFLQIFVCNYEGTNSYVKNEKNVRESSFSTKKKDEDIAD